MAWRTGNAANGYAVIFDSSIISAGNSFAIFGTATLKVNNAGNSRLAFIIRTDGGIKYRGIATNGAGTGIYLDGQGGTSSAITVGLNAPFAWCMRFNGLGAGAGSLFVRMLGSNTVTKVTCTTDADFNPNPGFLCFGDTTFSERWDGDVGQVIVYDGAAGAGLTDAQVEQQLQVARPIWPSVRAWYPTLDDVEASTLIDRSGNGYTLTDNGSALDITPNPAHPFGAPVQVVNVPAASGVSGALSGVGGTAAVGTLPVAHENPLNGSASTGQAGSVGPMNSKAVTGTAATGQPGTVAPGSEKALTGATGTSQVGTLASTKVIAISGVAGTGQVGDVSAGQAVVVALSGVAGSGQVGPLSPAASAAITGNPAAGQPGTVTPSVGITIASTGVQAATSVGPVAPASAAGLSGVQTVAAAGSVGVLGDVVVALTGSTATGAVGTVMPSRSGGVTGAAATSAAGSVVRLVAIALSGVPAESSVGALGVLRSLSLLGGAATLAPGALTVAGGAADRQYPLAGITQHYPLAGITQHYPLE